MTEVEQIAEMAVIQKLSHIELAKIWRFGGSDHPYITNPMLFDCLKYRLWDYYGGIPPHISKAIGWD